MLKGINPPPSSGRGAGACGPSDPTSRPLLRCSQDLLEEPTSGSQSPWQDEVTGTRCGHRPGARAADRHGVPGRSTLPHLAALEETSPAPAWRQVLLLRQRGWEVAQINPRRPCSRSAHRRQRSRPPWRSYPGGQQPGGHPPRRCPSGPRLMLFGRRHRRSIQELVPACLLAVMRALATGDEKRAGRRTHEMGASPRRSPTGRVHGRQE